MEKVNEESVNKLVETFVGAERQVSINDTTVRIRTSFVPTEKDKKGEDKPISLSQQTALRVPPGFTGFKSDFSHLTEGQFVQLYLKPLPPPPKNAPTTPMPKTKLPIGADPKDVGPTAPTKTDVYMILITNEKHKGKRVEALGKALHSLSDSGSAMSIEIEDGFDPYEEWLGIPKTQQPPTIYQLLGLSQDETDPEAIDEAVIRVTAFVRDFQIGPHAEACTRLLNEIAKARKFCSTRGCGGIRSSAAAPRGSVIRRTMSTVEWLLIAATLIAATPIAATPDRGDADRRGSRRFAVCRPQQFARSRKQTAGRSETEDRFDAAQGRFQGNIASFDRVGGRRSRTARHCVGSWSRSSRADLRRPSWRRTSIRRSRKSLQSRCRMPSPCIRSSRRSCPSSLRLPRSFLPNLILLRRKTLRRLHRLCQRKKPPKIRRRTSRPAAADGYEDCPRKVD